MKVAHTLLRVGVGGLFMAHGAQKLFGWFNGPGLEQSGQFYENALQMAPGKRNATAAGVTEFGGGAALVAGVATPLAATALTSAMVTAIWKVHKDKGFFNVDGGFEFNAVLIAALADIVEERSGSAAAVASLAAGTAGAFAAMELGRREYAKLHGEAGRDQSNGAAPAAAAEPASTPV